MHKHKNAPVFRFGVHALLVRTACASLKLAVPDRNPNAIAPDR